MTSVGSTSLPPAEVVGARAKLNMACGTDIRPRDEGWVNMDFLDLPGVDVVHNAFDTPWPFDDATFDYVESNHFFEHVPHQVPGHAKDGFIVLMEEIHRVLKPGGTLVVRCPHFACEWANTRDPTHTRRIYPENFAYVGVPDADGMVPLGDGGAVPGFYTDPRRRFRLVRWGPTRWSTKWPRFLPLGKSRTGLTVHLTTRFPSLIRRGLGEPWEAEYVLQRA